MLREFIIGLMVTALILLSGCTVRVDPTAAPQNLSDSSKMWDLPPVPKSGGLAYGNSTGAASGSSGSGSSSGSVGSSSGSAGSSTGVASSSTGVASSSTGVASSSTGVASSSTATSAPESFFKDNMKLYTDKLCTGQVVCSMKQLGSSLAMTCNNSFNTLLSCVGNTCTSSLGYYGSVTFDTVILTYLGNLRVRIDLGDQHVADAAKYLNSGFFSTQSDLMADKTANGACNPPPTAATAVLHDRPEIPAWMLPQQLAARPGPPPGAPIWPGTRQAVFEAAWACLGHDIDPTPYFYTPYNNPAMWPQLFYDFCHSHEFRVRVIKAGYAMLYGTNPNGRVPNGYEIFLWLEQFRAGATADQIWYSMAGSPEALARYTF